MLGVSRAPRLFSLGIRWILHLLALRFAQELADKGQRTT